MKKIKFNFPFDNNAVLSREELTHVLGGFSDDEPPNCQELGSACYGYLNCCNGLTCSTTTHLCKSAYTEE